MVFHSMEGVIIRDVVPGRLLLPIRRSEGNGMVFRVLGTGQTGVVSRTGRPNQNSSSTETEQRGHFLET